jgi:hypothetical protein
MRHALALCLALLAGPLVAQTILEDLSAPRAEWRFFTDQVMGGVSTGAARIAEVAGRPALHLTGTVSTENRGGFIQARRDLPGGLPVGTTALRITVRGDGQRYFLHLRSTGTVLPWQYYQAAFDTDGSWQEIAIPLSAFTASGALLRDTPRPEAVRSVALVAYGRDHAADVALARIAAE